MNYAFLRECFHFYFLERLLKISDPNLYCLKGGVNLRFFHNSPRYSEDMDLDVFAGSVDTLKKNGYKILNDSAFQRRLKTIGIETIEIGDQDKAKHTETVQRFKVNLVTISNIHLPTKVEFSRREKNPLPKSLDKIDPLLVRKFNSITFFCQHYTGESAVIQKLEALAGRTETQARDIFDLHILINRGYWNEDILKKYLTKSKLQLATQKGELLSYADFKGQVLEFIEVEEKENYSSNKKWEELKTEILEAIYGLF